MWNGSKNLVAVDSIAKLDCCNDWVTADYTATSPRSCSPLEQVMVFKRWFPMSWAFWQISR